MLMFAYIVGGWVQQDAYVIKIISEQKNVLVKTFAKCLRFLEQFIRTVKGQSNFGYRILF